MIVNKSGVGSATPSVLIVALAFFLPSKWDMTKSSPALLNWKTGANDGKINIKLYLPGIIMKFICFVLMLPLAFVLFKIINETKLLGLILTSDSGWYHNIMLTIYLSSKDATGSAQKNEKVASEN